MFHVEHLNSVGIPSSFFKQDSTEVMKMLHVEHSNKVEVTFIIFKWDSIEVNEDAFRGTFEQPWGCPHHFQMGFNRGKLRYFS